MKGKMMKLEIEQNRDYFEGAELTLVQIKRTLPLIYKKN
jgi:hypothetical protein